MIFPVWQPLATSSHQLAAQCGTELAELATHTGTLDPMAEGVLVILTGDDRYAKGSLSDWQKTYTFSILWGLKTDSGDRLGCILETQATSESETDFSQKLRQRIASFPRVYEQPIPAFSARRIAGGSSFDLAKQGSPLTVKTRTVTLSSISYEKIYTLSAAEIKTQHTSAISKVVGDFRQAAVLESWQEQCLHSCFITEHTVTVSAGTYIRQLVSDLSTQMNIPATTWSIVRTQNGPYTKEDCAVSYGTMTI